ncbi:MAG: thioredoxin family protein [Thiohalocapsa sp.]
MFQHKVTLLMATAALAVLFAGAVIAKPEVGQPAPVFTAADSTGKTWSLESLRGSPVILEWTNDHCPYVVKHYETGNMQELQRDAAEEGYVWLSVISSAPGKQGYVSPEKADELTSLRNAAPSAVLLDADGSIGQAYAARTTPHMYVIDETGTLVYMGGIDDKPTTDPADVAGAENYVRLAMADRAAGKPVQQAVTRPYGCSIKY